MKSLRIVRVLYPVIFVVAVLIVGTLMFFATNNARHAARIAELDQALKRIYQGLQIYAANNDDRMPMGDLGLREIRSFGPANQDGNVRGGAKVKCAFLPELLGESMSALRAHMVPVVAETRQETEQLTLGNELSLGGSTFGGGRFGVLLGDGSIRALSIGQFREARRKGRTDLAASSRRTPALDQEPEN